MNKSKLTYFYEGKLKMFGFIKHALCATLKKNCALGKHFVCV